MTEVRPADTDSDVAIATAGSPVNTSPAPAVAPVEPADPIPHVISIDEGQFNTAVCTCGWMTAGRRSRPLARQEARDHLLLYVGNAATR